MEKQRRCWARLALMVLLVGVVAGEVGVLAADARISLDFRNSPIETALTTLFQGTGRNYALAPGVTGSVTVSLRDMQFDQALQAMLRSAGLTYKLEDGVYMIRQKVSPANPSSYSSGATAPAAQTPPSEVDAELPSAEVRIEKIPLIYVDAVDIATMFGADTAMSRGQMLVSSGSAASPFGALTVGNGYYNGGGLNSYGSGGYGGGYGNSGYSGYNSGYGGYGGYNSGYSGYGGYRGYGYP